MIFNKRGQLTWIIILAVAIVAGILIYFGVRGGISGISGIPGEFAPVYQAYSDCIRDKAGEAIMLAGEQGGRVYIDDYVPGSEFAPYASSLSFLGQPVPYWYYVSGNGILKEQVPSKSAMEGEIAKYVGENIGDCRYDNLYSQGFSIEFGTPEVSVSVGSTRVDVSVNADVAAELENDTTRKTSHEVQIDSKLGKFYDIASAIYNNEKTNMFLDRYAVDVVNLYAPVDGTEIGCAPKIWKTRDVVDEIKNGLEANIGALKVKGDYYTLSKKENSYFVIDGNTDESVNFIYSANWPTKIEVNGNGVSDELMTAEPIGNKEGMGILGFCYAPYHFVYDVGFPVMVQVYDSNEIFQFPVVVIVDKNMPREAMAGSELNIGEEEPNICDFRTNDVEINIYDINLNSIDANLSYSCFDQECRLGETKNGKLIAKAPGCVNGYLSARASGYGDKKILFSSNSETTAELIMDREYGVDLRVEVNGAAMKGYAVVAFEGEQSKATVLPENSEIKLSEGLYNISVYVYGNTSITIPKTTKRECQEVAKQGISGFFGATEEKCFNIEIPETKIEQALIGGGKGEAYILPEQLQAGKIVLKVDGLPYPNSLEQLADNYARFDGYGVEVSL